MKKKDVAESSVLKDRVCIVCGNKFDVKLLENNVIPIQYFFSKDLIKNITDEDGEYWECEYCSGYFKEELKSIWSRTGGRDARIMRKTALAVKHGNILIICLRSINDMFIPVISPLYFSLCSL